MTSGSAAIISPAAGTVYFHEEEAAEGGEQSLQVREGDRDMRRG